ncbi:MAG: hypothetical protein QOE83_1397 [Actinomycetota bacterium]|nr:hypothetical protein [Actinomycetota bacterium]
MRRLRISIVGMSVILATTSLLGAATPAALANTRQQDVSRHQVLKATNGSRVNHHRGRLSINARMSALAEHHSEEMANRGSLFHTSNVGKYLHGVSWHAWGENVGYTQKGAVSELQKAFMRSPVHRENILNGTFKHVAIGTATRGGTLWVTVFFYG